MLVKALTFKISFKLIFSNLFFLRLPSHTIEGSHILVLSQMIL